MGNIFKAVKLIFFYSLVLFSVAGIFYLLRTQSAILLTITDIAVFAFLLYSLLHIGIVQGFRCDPFVWFKWPAIVLAYLFSRQLKKPYIVLYGIVVYGLFQSFVAIGQALLLLDSPHRFFAVTGTIGNPGPLGGFLAIATVCSAALFRQSLQEKNLRWILINGLITCFLIIGFLLADSRTALLSVLTGLLVVWSDKVWKFFKKHKAITFIVFAITVVVLCYLLYLYRPASADARLLIWQVSVGMITDKPLFGHGVGAFDREYMLYQAAYFEQYPQSSFVMVADNVAYPYNELIHVLIELGVVGACLLLAVFIAGFTSRSSGIVGRSLKAGLAAFILFSLFSYPKEIFELLLLPTVLLGVLPNKQVFSLCIFRWIKLAGIGFLTGTIFLSVAGLLVSYKTFEEIKQLAISDIPIPTPYCERYFPVFVYNAGFNTAYLSALCKFPCRWDYRSKTRNIFPSSETYCRLGEACEFYGEYKRAEQLYRKAATMVPSRILPNYYLWRLYVKLGDHNQARAMAQKILSQPVKVENTVTLRLKGEMRRYLKPK